MPFITSPMARAPRHLQIIVKSKPHGACLVYGYVDEFGSQRSFKWPTSNPGTSKLSGNAQIDGDC